MGKTRRRYGFTLLELTVTVAVIAVLLLILLAGMGRVRDHANRVQCVTNMRTLAAAVRLYANDNADAVIEDNSDSGRALGSGWLYTYTSWRNPNEPFSSTTKVPVGFYEPGRVTISPTLAWNLGATFNQQKHDPYILEQLVRRGQLWPFVRNYKFYLCPAEKPPFTLTDAQATAAMASARFRTDNQSPPNSGNLWVTPEDFYAARYLSAYKMNKTAKDNLRRLSMAVKTNAFLFWEADETIFDLYGWASWNDGANEGSQQGLTPRHGDKGATVALIDGSAEYILRAKFKTSGRFDPTP